MNIIIDRIKTYWTRKLFALAVVILSAITAYIFLGIPKKDSELENASKFEIIFHQKGKVMIPNNQIVTLQDLWCGSIKSLPENMPGYYNLMYETISQKGRKLQCMNSKLKNDVSAVVCAIAEPNNSNIFKDYGKNIQYASSTIKDNKDVGLMAVERSYYAINYLSERLKKDKDIIRESMLAKQRKKNKKNQNYSYHYKYSMDISKCNLKYDNPTKKEVGIEFKYDESLFTQEPYNKIKPIKETLKSNKKEDNEKMRLNIGVAQ